VAKRPWRSHYTRDWATDPFVRGLDLESRMVYLELLDIAWDEGGLRQDWVTFGTYVAQRIGISRRKFVACWAQVRVKFEEKSPGIWTNSRLEDERIKAEEFSEKQSKAGKLRHAKPANAQPQHRVPAQPSQSHTQSQSQSQREIAAADAPPLPFKPAEAVQALASASCGRFTASKLSKGQAINCQRLIREAPALSTWTLAGEWLAAGGDGWKGQLDIRNLGDFSTWVAHAERWVANGRGPVNAKNGTSKTGNTPPTASYAVGGEATEEFT
jgi:biotin carboxyl carrier protein